MTLDKKKITQNIVYRGLHLFEGEGKRVRCVVKDTKGKKIIYKAIKR